MKKHFLLIYFTLLVSSAVQGQQQATFSQYMFNGLAINPAYAGSHQALSASLLTRFQNVGLPGAPKTQTMAVHTPLLNQRIALGILIVHDKISVVNQTGVNGIYAYRLPFRKGILSMGIQAGYSAYNAAYSELELYQPDVLFEEDVRQIRPNFGAGVFYSTNIWYAGLSMPHMANNIFQRGDNLKTVRQNVPLILSGGYVFTVNPMIKFKPNILFKWVDSRAVELDVNANVLFDEVLWAGVSYKFFNALNWMVQVQVTDQLQFGYSYSVTTGPLRKVELGSHEVMLSYRFKYFSKGIVTPRYF